MKLWQTHIHMCVLVPYNDVHTIILYVCVWGAAIFIFVTRIRPVDPEGRTSLSLSSSPQFVAESREHLKCYKFICDPQPEEQLNTKNKTNKIQKKNGEKKL